MKDFEILRLIYLGHVSEKITVINHQSEEVFMVFKCGPYKRELRLHLSKAGNSYLLEFIRESGEHHLIKVKLG